jgi:uncharacterized protein (UPF0261 family)
VSIYTNTQLCLSYGSDTEWQIRTDEYASVHLTVRTGRQAITISGDREQLITLLLKAVAQLIEQAEEVAS